MSDTDPRVQADLDELDVVTALRAGDEDAFAMLIDTHYTSMLRVARLYVATQEAAEDAVQEAFLGVIRGIGRFEARSSLRTWMFRILVNRAKSRGERERRSQPFSSFDSELEPDEPAVDGGRFRSEGRWAGFWSAPPSADHLPEARILAAEVAARLAAAIEDLPPAQRTVITLRDVHGLSATEVCDLLDLTESNQRVLLHRARSKARASLEGYLGERVEV